eukprot:g8543.t1
MATQKACDEDDVPECPVDCELSEWTWMECSQTCGNQAQRIRARRVVTEPNFGGKTCVEVGGAPQHGDVGVKLRETYRCPGLPACPDPPIETPGAAPAPVDPDATASPPPQPTPCVMHEWTDFGKCSATCGKGVQVRTRDVKSYAEHGGEQCPDLVEEVPCAGADLVDGNVTIAGESLPECPQDCELGDWSVWGDCSVTCGEGGLQMRYREVVQNATELGLPCPDKVETRECGKVDDSASTSTSSGDDGEGEMAGAWWREHEDPNLGSASEVDVDDEDRRLKMDETHPPAPRPSPGSGISLDPSDTLEDTPLAAAADNGEGDSDSSSFSELARNKKKDDEDEDGRDEHDHEEDDHRKNEEADRDPCRADDLWKVFSSAAAVCGTNGRTYVHEGQLSCEASRQHRDSKLEKAHDGACNENDLLDPCKTIPEIDAWVCGSDGVSYHNAQDLLCAMSKRPDHLLKAHDGKCEDHERPPSSDNEDTGDHDAEDADEPPPPFRRADRRFHDNELSVPTGDEVPPACPVKPIWNPLGPLNCEVSPWDEWGPCSTTCGWGTKTRRARILKRGNAGGWPCPDDATLFHVYKCMEVPCEEDDEQDESGETDGKANRGEDNDLHVRHGSSLSCDGEDGSCAGGGPGEEEVGDNGSASQGGGEGNSSREEQADSPSPSPDGEEEGDDETAEQGDSVSPSPEGALDDGPSPSPTDPPISPEEPPLQGGGGNAEAEARARAEAAAEGAANASATANSRASATGRSSATASAEAKSGTSGSFLEAGREEVEDVVRDGGGNGATGLGKEAGTRKGKEGATASFIAL